MPEKGFRIVYLGTPEFAVLPLESLLKAGYNVVAVITQPDRPVGRKAIITPPPVKAFALLHNIPVLQYEKLRDAQGSSALLALNADLGVVAAFGQILSDENIKAPKLGMVNIHGSLLPKYRGASPAQSAVIDGLTQTGVTIQKVCYELDAGDILHSSLMDIYPNETSGELLARMSKVGSDALIDALPGILSQTAQPLKQDPQQATFCSMLKKETCVINWSKPASELHNLVRGCNPWPIAQCNFNKKLLKIYQTLVVEGKGSPGEVLANDKKLVIACGSGALELLQVQAPSAKRMDGASFLRGTPINLGDIIGEQI